MQLDYSGEPIDGRGVESSVDPAFANDARATMLATLNPALRAG
jgi:hypothetical protein